jgi:Amt family ammonium transporter
LNPLPFPSSAEVALPEWRNAAILLCILFVLLIPLAGAGLSLMNTGLGRSRSAAHTMLASLLVAAVAAAVYFVCGFSWQGVAGRAEHLVIVGGKPWGWVASERFFLRGLPQASFPAALGTWLVALFGMLSAGMAAMIPLGSGGDRWRLSSSSISAALLAGVTYPLFAHWAWGGGWLAQLGANYGLGSGFLDAGGSGAIQAVGGLTALSVSWILGPRRGKYSMSGMPSAIPGHNAVFVQFGCLLALLGWLGLNCAGAILFYGGTLSIVPPIVANTLLSAAGASIMAAWVTNTRFGKPDASLCGNSWIGGLVASSASCAFVAPAAALVIGLVTGVLITFSVEWFELRLRVDDPGGAISVHALGGFWGILAAGIFNRFPGEPGQWLAQMVGIATLVGFVLPLTYGLNWLLDRFYPQRVAAEGERQGMDLYELGAGAYPELEIHNEEYM